ncbi:response regulator transcription factor [bacterium]|nr:response regulator transcription factor [bacterium]
MSEGKTILLVEDDVNLGMVLQESLEMTGFTVLLARDGEEGLERYREQPVDLCVLDVMLPRMDGFALAAAIREDSADIPIIFLTAKSLKEDRIEGFRLGGDDYVTKPFSMEELILRIQAVLKRSGGPDQQPSPDMTYTLGEYRFDPRHRELSTGDGVRKLTGKESELLRLLCEYRNRLLPRATALKQVWGEDTFFTGRSMDVYITKLRKHLGGAKNVEIINVHGKGFKMITS